LSPTTHTAEKHAKRALYYSKFLLPFYVVLGGIVYTFFLRLLKVLDEGDLAFLQQVFGGRIGLVVRKVLY
jgi:hypothetical protein